MDCSNTVLFKFPIGSAPTLGAELFPYLPTTQITVVAATATDDEDQSTYEPVEDGTVTGTVKVQFQPSLVDTNEAQFLMTYDLAAAKTEMVIGLFSGAEIEITDAGTATHVIVAISQTA